jgi:iron complex outermembrane receptor protein
LALVAGAAYAQDAQPAAPAAAEAAPQATQSEIVVTGSRLRRRQEDVATPIVTLGQDQIKNTGQLQIGDLTKYIPQNVGSTGGVQDLAKGGIDSRDARSANLRGLGSGATLVMLNGRRVNPYEGYVNLNALTPSIAVQRVETLLGGASSIYGADAVAGVVNVITNQKFEGFDASGQYTHLDKANNYQLSAMFGAGSESFHVVTSAE